VIKFKKILACLLLSIFSSALFAADFEVKNPENTLVMQLKTGKVYIELRPQWAPNHVARLKTLVKQKFYDGIVFHRVIAGFMAQTGDPTGAGTGGSDLPDLRAEFTRNKHSRGAVSMARSQSPDSANSQFFICFEKSPWLDNNYTIFGQVINGMKHIDALEKGQASSGIVSNPDKIISLRIASDLKQDI